MMWNDFASEALPEPGTVFMFRMPNKMRSICRVLRHGIMNDRLYEGEPKALIAGSVWIGTEPPELDNPRLRELLVLTHHSWNADLHVGWVLDLPPLDFLVLGTLLPTAEDLLLDSIGQCGWEAFPMHAFMQWRWDHERDAVLQEDTEEDAEAEAWMRQWNRVFRRMAPGRRKTDRR